MHGKLVAQQTYTEYELKAAYIVKFSKFISWPENNENIVIGILGDDPFGQILEEMIKYEEQKNRKWIIEHYKSLNEITNCTILFVAKGVTIPTKDILKATNEKSILTIGDEIDNFCKLGGMIRLNDPSAARPFWMNLEAAYQVCLKVHPQLVRIAHVYGKIPDTNQPCNQ